MSISDTAPDETQVNRKLGSGVRGLDDILGGGFPAGHVYLIEGDPGTGKTTLAMQFLLEGIRQDESTLYVTLSETAAELRMVARSHGWSLDGINIHELTPSETQTDESDDYTILDPSEVELGELTRAVLDEVDTIRPVRIVVDSLSELRLLARDPLRYRRQVLALRQFFAGRGSTVLLLDDRSVRDGDLQLQSISHGVLRLDMLPGEYGPERRRIRVMKLRGVAFRGGYHDLTLRTGGLDIYPRLVAAETRESPARTPVTSGVAELDDLLGGGLDRGTSTLLMGPAGAGKSTLAAQYARAAADRGERVWISIFDESIETYLARSTGLGIDLRQHVDSGQVTLQQVDPAELSPGEFVHRIRQAALDDGARVVIIDSLNGYLNAMPEERFLVVQLHELLTFLGQFGILTILVSAQHGLIGSVMQTPIDVSYLADTVILFRYFEADGAIRQALSVIKKRSGHHERTIRELRLGPAVTVGAPLREFHGILSGQPSFRGDGGQLLEHDGTP